MTRKAYIVGPKPSGGVWNPDADAYIPVTAGQTVWVDLDACAVDRDGDVKAFAAFDSEPLDYGYVQFTDLTPVPEVYDSGFDTETGTGYVTVDGEAVYVGKYRDPQGFREDADGFERDAEQYTKIARTYRAVADWMEAREANDPVKKAVALINNAPDGANLAKYLIENGVVFP